MYKIGENFLITTNNWFFAPDGNQYKAVWGTIKGIHDDEEALGIKTNRHSANWFVEIGDMTIAGCQIYYAINCPNLPSTLGPTLEIAHEGQMKHEKAPISRIYIAN